jgi:hypothetical protein
VNGGTPISSVPDIPLCSGGSNAIGVAAGEVSEKCDNPQFP